MKKCNECHVLKDDNDFYIDVRSKTNRREAKCKDCRKQQAGKLPKRKYVVKYDGYKTCNECGESKHVEEFGINRARKGGRKPECEVCEYTGLNLARRANGPIFKPLNVGSEFIPKYTEYKQGNCEVCEISFDMCRPSHKRCDTCSYLVRDIQHHLLQKRNGKTVEIDHHSTSVDLAIQLSKLYINTHKCTYCNRKFTDDNPKHIDHVHPIHLGGTHKLSNMTICCKECNWSKNGMSFNDWLNTCKLVSLLNVDDIYSIIRTPPSMIGQSQYERECRICFTNIDNEHAYSKSCTSCQVLLQKLNSSLTASRQNKSLPCAVDVIVNLARKWINTDHCCFCRRIFTSQNKKSLDHVVPIYLGGKNTSDNLIVSCLGCNKAKSFLDLRHWIGLCKLIVIHNCL